jgi:hypothetical protein
MIVTIKTWYSETVQDIFSKEIDEHTKPIKGSSSIEMVYTFKNDTLYHKVSTLLEHAKACTLVRNFTIEH